MLLGCRHKPKIVEVKEADCIEFAAAMDLESCFLSHSFIVCFFISFTSPFQTAHQQQYRFEQLLEHEHCLQPGGWVTWMRVPFGYW